MSTRINEEKIKSNLAKIKKLRAILSGKDPSEIEKKEKQNFNLNKKTNNKAAELEKENEANLVEEEVQINENNQENKESNENQNDIENNNNPSATNNNYVLENNSSINLNLNAENQYSNDNNINQEQENSDKISNNNNINNKDNDQNPTELEIKKIQKQIFAFKKKTAFELLNDLYDLLQIDDPKAYQPKMKGFIIPFYSDKVNIRIPENSPGKKIFKSDPISQENLKRILKERKEQKLKELEEKEKLEKLNIIENKKKSKIVNEKIKSNITNNHDKLYSTKDKIPNKYTEIKKKQENIIKEKETKLTWDQLENLNFNHFITNREDDFNPNDLFDDTYDSDDENIFDDIQHTDKNTISSKLKKTKDTASSYLNIQTNLNIMNNINNDNSTNIASLPDSIIKSYSGKSREIQNHQYSDRAYNGDLLMGNSLTQSAVKNLNVKKSGANNSPVNVNKYRNNTSLHSSYDANYSNNLSIYESESNKANNNKLVNNYNNNSNANDIYEMQKRSPGNKSLNLLEKNAGYNSKVNIDSYPMTNAKNLIVRNNSPRKILNRSNEKSAAAYSNKNKRSSSKSNVHINAIQRYTEIQSPKSIKGLNNERINRQIYSIEKTEKMARELEKNREDQKSRVNFFKLFIFFFQYFLLKFLVNQEA